MSVWQIAVVSLSQERKQKEGVDHEDEGALVCENMNLGGTSSISRGDVTSSSDVKGVVPVGGDIWYPGRPQPRGNGHFVQDVDEPRVARRGEEGRRGIQVWRCGAMLMPGISSNAKPSLCIGSNTRTAELVIATGWSTQLLGPTFSRVFCRTSFE